MLIITSEERREIRYQRRKAKRNKNIKILSYEEVFSYNNLYSSAKKCKKNVNWKASTQIFNLNRCKKVFLLYNSLQNNKFKSKGFHNFTINERGKIRHISSVCIDERCIQKTLCDYSLTPLLSKKFIYDNAASIEGKGIDFSLKRLSCHLKRHFKQYGQDGYILQFDFASYFENIEHEKLLDLLKDVYKSEDNELYKLTKTLIKRLCHNKWLIFDEK